MGTNNPQNYCYTCLTASFQGCSGKFGFGERFPRPRSQQRGSLRPRARRVAVLGVGVGGVAPSR